MFNVNRFNQNAAIPSNIVKGFEGCYDTSGCYNFDSMKYAV